MSRGASGRICNRPLLRIRATLGWFMKVIRNYEIRKYVRASSAEEAIRLSKKAPIIEVIDRDNKPAASNDGEQVHAVGFFMPEGRDG